MCFGVSDVNASVGGGIKNSAGNAHALPASLSAFADSEKVVSSDFFYFTQPRRMAMPHAPIFLGCAKKLRPGSNALRRTLRERPMRQKEGSLPLWRFSVWLDCAEPLKLPLLGNHRARVARKLGMVDAIQDRLNHGKFSLVPLTPSLHPRRVGKANSPTLGNWIFAFRGKPKSNLRCGQ